MSGKSESDQGRPGERIAKVMARAGLGSRREAEAWIAAGRVAINGAVIASPAVNVTPKDRVTVDGAALPTRERTRLFLYHKPRGLVTTHADPQGRPTIFAALPKDLPRLISVGRLDTGTEGLLLLTNDGGLARALELPATAWLRRYRVRAHGRVTQGQLDSLRHGVTIDGIRYGAIDASVDRQQAANVWLTFAIREGKNREVKNVLGHLGLAVARLIRVSFGPFQLGELPSGAIEEVKRATCATQALGERLAARRRGFRRAMTSVPLAPPPPARAQRPAVEEEKAGPHVIRPRFANRTEGGEQAKRDKRPRPGAQEHAGGKGSAKAQGKQKQDDARRDDKAERDYREKDKNRGQREKDKNRGQREEGRNRGQREEGRNRGQREEGRNRGQQEEGRNRGQRENDKNAGAPAKARHRLHRRYHGKRER